MGLFSSPSASQRDKGQCTGTVQSLQGLEAPPATLWKPLVPDSPQTDVTHKIAHRVTGLREQAGPHPISLKAPGLRGRSSRAQARAPRGTGSHLPLTRLVRHYIQASKKVVSPSRLRGHPGKAEANAGQGWPGPYRSVTLFSTAAAICWSR